MKRIIDKYSFALIRFVLYIAFPLLGQVCLWSSCSHQVENAQRVNEMPDIFPDYVDVTIPVGIAPMNFGVEDMDAQCVDVVARGSKGGEMHVQGEYADFDVEEWHQLTEQNKGGDITFTVCVEKGGKWYQYNDFKMHVSELPLEDFGLTYRLIPPGYEVGGNIGIYQRDIHNFDEFAIIQETAVPGQCMNCHTSNQCRADQFLMHLRGDKGGTMVQMDGKQTWLNTKTDSTKANCGYSYWHPSGNYIASSINSIHQLFFVRKERRIEVFDTMSDVLVIDTRNNELILNPKLQQPDWLETYPVFSPDGKTLYFCTAKAKELPTDYDKIHYSLCKIAFDANTGKYGDKVDTLLYAKDTASLDSLPLGGDGGGSYTYPRPSYDGKWLMYNVSDFGNFPVNHKESDIWLMNLQTGETHPLESNSDDSDSFHNWSSNSHWFVFSSRRGDGMYNLAYISSIDDKGKASKPFLLPQRNPKKFYAECFDSFNCPDFTKDKVDFDVKHGARQCLDGDRENVKVRL